MTHRLIFHAGTHSKGRFHSEEVDMRGTGATQADVMKTALGFIHEWLSGVDGMEPAQFSYRNYASIQYVGTGSWDDDPSTWPENQS